ncbi:hypothetical protein ABVT39_021608 [Epinephelus coioides]
MAAVVHGYRHQRRTYNPGQYAESPNLLEHDFNDELHARYRFGQEDIALICNILCPHLERATLRSHALTVEEQVLMALCYYACGSFFEVIGDGLAVTKATVGHMVHSVSSTLTSLLGQYVKWPENEEEIARTKRMFFSLGGMPNTIGVIDCTHVHFQAPHIREWEESHLYQKQQQTDPDGILLGDSGYPLLPWLMTPFATVTNDSQQRYNKVHATTRGTIERLNKVIKHRFACQNYLCVEPQKACHIICACIVLHNLAQTRRVPLQEPLIDGRPPCSVGLDLPPPPLQSDGPAGRPVQNAMVNLYFSN